MSAIIKKITLTILASLVALIFTLLLLLTTSNILIFQPSVEGTPVHSSKIIPLTTETIIEKQDTKSISITGKEKRSVVTSAIIILSDGSQKRLYALEGSLLTGQTKSVSFANKQSNRIISLKIKSYTPFLIGSRGRISISSNKLGKTAL